MQQAHWFTVTVGDWSDDGHGKTDTHLINSSLSKHEMETAYKAGAKILGIDMVANLCEEYEDGTVDKGTVDAFKATGLDLYNLSDKWDREEFDEIGKLSARGLWVAMWLHVCKLGATDLVAFHIDEADINIGGYGLRS